MLDASVVAVAAGAAGIALVLLRRPWLWTALALTAIAHIAILAAVAFFPIPLTLELSGAIPRDGFSWIGLNLAPLGTIGPSIAHGVTVELRIAILNLFVLFPAGIYAPILVPRLRTDRALIVLAVVGGASAELIQLAVSLAIGFLYRTVDIDDVILNTAGLALGLLVTRLAIGRWPRLAVGRERSLA